MGRMFTFFCILNNFNILVGSLTAPCVTLTAGKHTIRLEYYENVGGAIAKLFWQVISTPEQSTVQSPVTVNISGEREGKVENKPAKLSIAQNGNNLSGSIVYDNVKEYLSGEITNDKIILRGTGYEGEVLVPPEQKPVPIKPKEEVWDWVFEWEATAKQLASGEQKVVGRINDAQIISYNERVLKFRYKRPSGKIVDITLDRHSPEEFYFGSVAQSDLYLRVWLLPDERGNFKGRFDNGHGKTTMEVFLKKRPSENDYKPKMAIPAPQAKLTKAMQKYPGVLIKLNGIYRTLDNAKVNFLNNDLIQKAVKYARIRVDWQLTPGDSRNEIGSLRTRARNAFIYSSYLILSLLAVPSPLPILLFTPSCLTLTLPWPG